MNRDQIESSRFPEIDLSDLMTGPGSRKVKTEQYVNLNGEVSPAVLAGLLDCNVSLIYQMRQNGRLPPDSGASLKDNIRYHLEFWKKKAANKVNGLQDAATLQKIQLDRVRTEQAWLGVKKDRGELVEVEKLALVFEPYFTQLRTQLCSLARKHPEMQIEIDKIMNNWARLGEEVQEIAKKELDTFIEQEMEKEIDTGTEEEADE